MRLITFKTHRTQYSLCKIFIAFYIVKNAIGIPELSFQEKGKLNELWDTFKEFNRDILVAILDDLSKKANDFNKNFLFYISQIRSNYLEKLSKFKEAANE